jgi:hypothetical protein
MIGFLVSACDADAQTRFEAQAVGEAKLHPQTRYKAQPVGETEFSYLELVVDNGYSLTLGAAELATTVVPPGLKTECPAGRLLISNDGLIIRGNTTRSPGDVRGFDLDQLAVQATTASVEKLNTITTPPVDVDGGIWSNDSDLVTLPNGDVIYLRMGRGKWPLKPEPDWFSVTRRAGTGWGPGARSVIYVWRSEDCGQVFELRTFIDTALLEINLDGSVVSGGLPQATPEQAEGDPPWNMGGTDGPMAYVDHETGDLYYTMRIVGNLPDESDDGSFRPSAKKINRTVVMRSGDRGDNWHQVITLGFPEFRADMLRVDSRFYFVEWGRRTDGVNKVRLCSERIPGTGSDGWPDSFCSVASAEGEHRWDNSNRNNQPVMARGPVFGKPLVLQPETLGAGDGYRVYFVDYPNWREFVPIAPKSGNPQDSVLHPTVIDTGEGPVFIYWYDVDEAANQATIRGRVVISDNPYANLGDRMVGDFVVDGPFALGNRWYGEYHTAGGYRSQSNEMTTSYTFYPVWVQPGRTVHFARVTYRVQTRPDLEHDRLIPKEIPIPTPDTLQAPVLKGGEDG